MARLMRLKVRMLRTDLMSTRTRSWLRPMLSAVVGGLVLVGIGQLYASVGGT